MASLRQDTTVEGGGGDYTAQLSPDWCVWSPQGGYLMATALRAAGLATAFARPLSLTCHFLAVPRPEQVQLSVLSLRKARVAESLRISMRQGDRPILEVVLWAGDGMDGLSHSDLRMPEVPGVDTLASTPLVESGPALHTLWNNLEQRPCGPLHWERKSPAEARQRDWVRVRSHEPTGNPFIDAVQYLVLLDAFTWPAAAHAHVGDTRFIAPTLSMTVDFHRFTDSDWLLSDAHSPTADDGTIAVHSHLWSPAAQLLATGTATLICKPSPWAQPAAG